jgi:hypothetical protein
MQKISSLNDLFQQYSLGVLKRKQFEELLFGFIVENHQRFHLYNWERDDFIDYLSWLYPRIKRAIDKYRETRAPFETYIGAIMRWSAREYRFRRSDHRITEYTTWSIKHTEMMTRENEPEYLPLGSGPDLVANPRQVLFLILKSYYFVSDDFLARIAPKVGIKKETLLEMITKIRNLRAKRDAEISLLRERSYGQFYRCIAYERRLKALPETSVYHARMRAQLERARKRLAAIRRRLAKTRREATNAQIAETLGIPKGTVDSAIYLLKNRIDPGKKETPEPEQDN